MNLLDNIIWFMILSLLISVSVNYIWGITNIAYIAQSNFESTSIMEKTELVLRHNLNSIIIDKNKLSYKQDYKTIFLSNTFEWQPISITSSITENNTYNCYNYNLNKLKINIYKKINNNEEIDFWWDFIKTDEDWEANWTEYLNVLCFYNTYDYLNAWNIINSDKSPISYIIYSLYTDLKFNNKLLEKKWILYFN